MYTQPLKMHFSMFRDPDEREYRIRLENGPDTPYCRRRIKTEEKAKVVASVWGKIYSIPCNTIDGLPIGRF